VFKLLTKRKNLENNLYKSATSPLKSKCSLTIDFFPSKTEVMNTLENFLESNNLNKEYFILKLNSVSMNIAFKESDIAYSFMRKLNNEKKINHLYYKVRTYLNFDQPVSLKHNIYPEVNRNKSVKKENYYDEILDKISKVCNTSEDKKEKKGNEWKIMKMFSHINQVKDNKLKKRILQEYYKQSGSLLSSSPYENTNKDIFKEYLLKKEKWINKNGFLPSISNIRSEGSFNYNDVNYNLPYPLPRDIDKISKIKDI